MRLREIAYKQRKRAQDKADEWQTAFPRLKVTLSYTSRDDRYRIRVENPITGKIGYLSSGKI